MELDRYEAMY